MQQFCTEIIRVKSPELVRGAQNVFHVNESPDRADFLFVNRRCWVKSSVI